MPRPLDPQHALGVAIREARLAANLSQEELAHRADLHPTWISHIERGDTNPTWSTVERIARGLGIPLSELAAAAESQ